MQRLREVLVLVVGLLPASRLKNFALRRLGHHVARSAHIGPCLLVGVGSLELAEGARIGTGNVFRGLVRLRLGPSALIGQLNWCTAAPFLVTQGESGVAGTLQLEAGAAITQRHYLDCAGGLLIGERALVAGVHSVLMSHEVDHRVNRLVCAPIRIGRCALLSSKVAVVMGAVVPESSLVAMGATVVRGLTTPGRLYAGMPARDKGPVGGEFFERVEAEVPAGPAPSRPRVDVPPGE